MIYVKNLLSLLAMAAVMLMVQPCQAQNNGAGASFGAGCTDAAYSRSARRFHPRPFKGGEQIHNWNCRQAQIYPWNTSYNYWQYGAPTALVVPPTAAFQSEYNWGVAQTRSIPIYHQFGRNYYGLNAENPGASANTPYWPSSTHQFGIYSVRGPW